MSDETKKPEGFEQATNRPWSLDTAGSRVLVRSAAEVVARIEPWNRKTEEADGALIVQAVNAYEPMRALLEKCATTLEPFGRFLDVLESRVERPPIAEQIHEIHYPAGDAEINRTMLRTARALLAVLRAAGVEPKP